MRATRARLRALVQSPGPLSLSTLLPEVVDLPEERAAVLDRLGRRREAAAVLALHDLDKAEAYAAACADPREACAVVLAEAVRRDPTGELAVGVLERRASKVDVLGALEALPDDAPVDRVARVVSAELARAASAHREALVVRQLLKRDNFAATLALHRERAASFVVTADSRCAACRRAFKGDAAFVRFPDGALRHRACVSPAVHVALQGGQPA